MTVYETIVNRIGPSVEAFLDEKMLILFGDNAPAELADYCLLINVNPVEGEIEAGDQLVLGEKGYRITAVGDAVKKNLTSLGHITLKFDGATQAELPGTLYLEESQIDKVNVEDVIKIQKQ
jgi:glucitol/sorbitol PTS system EIIA component